MLERFTVAPSIFAAVLVINMVLLLDAPVRSRFRTLFAALSVPV